MLANDQLDRWDRENFFHPSTHLAHHSRGESPSRIVTGGSGIFIEDRNGNRLLDGFAGLYCVNVGYGRTEIADAIAEQARKLACIRVDDMLLVDPAQLGRIEIRRGAADPREVEMVDHFVAREDLLITVRPAEAQQVVEHGRG